MQVLGSFQFRTKSMGPEMGDFSWFLLQITPAYQNQTSQILGSINLHVFFEALGSILECPKEHNYSTWYIEFECFNHMDVLQEDLFSQIFLKDAILSYLGNM